jgi:LacI family transcriptional regulator, galactose operon repressor
MHDVAAHAGVSPMTVSRVINDQARVSDDTRRRVQASIETLGYVPNRLARALSRRRTSTFGVIVPDLANPFFTLVVRGIEEVARRADHHVILCNSYADPERERAYLEDMVSFQVEGVLIAPVSDRSRPHMRLLARERVPFVMIDRSIGGFTGDLVQGDSVAGAQRAVEHLIGLGHRRIGMVTETDEVSTARDRQLGYRAALAAAGLEVHDELIAYSSVATDADAARAAADRLLALADPPSALFAVNNIAVVGVVEAARARGLAIPDDVALVCFDEIEHLARVHPFLTVLAQPAETFGTLATQLLLDRIAGRIDDQPRTVVLPGTLIVRESSGAPVTLGA